MLAGFAERILEALGRLDCCLQRSDVVTGLAAEVGVEDLLKVCRARWNVLTAWEVEVEEWRYHN